MSEKLSGAADKGGCPRMKSTFLEAGLNPKAFKILSA